MSESLSDYDFALPTELIASRPPSARDGARMMVIDRAAGTLSHRMFTDFPGLVRPGDLVLLNDSRVIKARLFSADGTRELLLLEPHGGHRWTCLVKPGRRMRVGAEFSVADTTARVREVLPDGERVVEFASEPDLERHGSLPIPPYFNREADADDDVRYQTVFAHDAGSVAAPTAGLHFTPQILARLPHAFVTLHVGMGTFQPVKAERIEEHRMHRERYAIPGETARSANDASRLFCVGTTVTRVLESQIPGPIAACSGETAIFIRPPYAFRRAGALLTNFHLPKSTLLMLVSALAGRELILRAYAEAVRERYRFFSYGDCMAIV